MPEPFIEHLLQVAMQHHQAGRLPEAEILYRRILDQCPRHADALHLMGVVALQSNHLEHAVKRIGEALAVEQENPLFMSNLGNALSQQGQLDEAIAWYRRALELQPRYPQTQTLLGVALKKKGLPNEAIAWYRRALEINPEYADAHNNLGSALNQLGLIDEATACYRRALALNPKYPEALYNLAIALRTQGRLEEALSSYQGALKLQPNFADAHYNLGNVLQELGRRDEAIACYKHAIVLRPHFAEAHYNLALELLLKGDYASGWPHYEWRWKCKDFHSPAREFSQPLWDGADLAGRTIHLHAEQGLGDSIHFVRYVKLVARHGGIINLECQPQLKRLFETIPEVSRVVTTGELLPTFDVHCPLQTLPLLLGTIQENIPREVPYLQPSPDDVEGWKKRLPSDTGDLKVGLVWAGNSLNINDRNRSVAPSILTPLCAVPGVCFYSLQKGEAARKKATLCADLKLVDWTESLHDFADTAALVANLDLVISVDTAVAHLAGAMGKPVWLMGPAAPDWRWMLHRGDSPWYPTMRIFRQVKRGAWDDVVSQMSAALSLLAKAR